MSPDTLIVAAALALAAGFLGHRAWRTFFSRRNSGCAGGCGCASKLAKK
jgi:hypothetical protein